MAKHGVKVLLDIPDEVSIEFIRKDYASISNVFRVAFEVALAVFSGLLGYWLTTGQMSRIDYVLILIMVAALLFTFGYFFYYQRLSGKHNIKSANSLGDIPLEVFKYKCNVPLSMKELTHHFIKDTLKKDAIWKPNSIKREHITLSVGNMNNSDMKSLRGFFEGESIKIIDEAIKL